MGTFLRKLRSIVASGRVKDDIRREMDTHVEMEIAERRRRGMSAEEARRTALRDFGGVERFREEMHDSRGITFWDTLRQDARFAVRTLRRAPGYTAAAVLTLALGIGANTAMFSVVKGVLLDPLPFTKGDELVLIQQSARKSNRPAVGVSIPELQDYRARLASVRDLVEYHGMSFTLLNQGDPDRVDTGVVSANFFDMLGTRALHGRTFIDTDDDLGAEAVLVLSYAYWRDKFGADPNVIGRVLEMNNKPHTVVGVLPNYPQYPRENDVYMPTAACPYRAAAEQNQAAIGHRAFGALQVFGRLAPGANLERATAEISTIAQSFERDHPQVHERARLLGFTGQAAYLEEELIENARPLLWALAGVTMLVLLIACANVANLALARTFRRGRELAVRTALGAGRGRLVRQLMTESVIVAFAGAAFGLALAWLSLDLLATFMGRFTPRTSSIEIDGGVLAFTAVAAIATGLAFGLAPVLSTRSNLAQTMRDGAAGSGEAAGRHRVRSTLVVAQVGVSFALLVGSALLLQSFHRLSSVPLGFNPDGVMTAAIFGNFSRQNVGNIEDAILERLRSSPGVRSAALTTAVPQSAIQPGNSPITIERAVETAGALVADANVVSDQYFDTLGVPLVAGRDFRAADTIDAPRVAIINRSMAAFWQGSDPLGQRFTAPGPGNTELRITVVGIAEDFRLYSVDQAISAQFYVPLRQNPGAGTRLLVRADGDQASIARLIREQVHAVDATTPVEEVATLASVREDAQLAAPALTAGLLTLFAGVALFVTLAGIAGVIGTSVSQRTREFGLRMALGASRLSVLRLVLGQGAVLVAAGLVIGVAGAYWFSQLIDSFLFATTTTDPLAYGAVALLFLVAALAATFGPARRATSIDPLVALKTD